MKTFLAWGSWLACGAVVATLSVATACSSDDSGGGDGTTTGGTTGGTTGSTTTSTTTGGTTTGGTTGNDGGTALNGCTTFVDGTDADGGSRTLTWDFSITTDPKRCLKIKAGQSVTWSGNFTTHPLAAAGGSSPNPVQGNSPVGTTVAIPFPNAGTYGFVCGAHPQMKGAIEVTP